jgi:heptosyltransferase-2
VIQTAFLGDVILTTPLLAALAARFGPVDVVTTPAAAALLEGHPGVRRVIRYDKRGADRGWSGLWRLAAGLHRTGYRRVYLPHRSWRSAALALLSGARERIGFGGTPAAITYTGVVSRPASGHEVERLLALAGEGPDEPPPVSLAIAREEEAAADRWLAARGLEPGFVALAPGSIWGTKRWPYYPDLAARLDRAVVVVGGPDDAKLAETVVAAAPGRGHSAAGALGLGESAALIRRAALLVTNDSAPLHLATAVQTPIVALFGPTAPAQGFAPRGPGDVVVEHPMLDCRPCSAHGPMICPLGHHRCMQEIGVERVLAAVMTILGREEARAIRPRH